MTTDVNMRILTLVAAIGIAFLNYILCAIDDVEIYCKYSHQSTACKYRCARSVACGYTPDPFLVMTDDHRHYIENEHNKYRDKVSAGVGHIPRIRNLVPLSYDLEAEFLAGCYIKRCSKDLDKASFSMAGERMGQNIYSKKSGRYRALNAHMLKEAHSAWTKELTEYMANKENPANDVAHLISNDTRYFGCAMIHISIHEYDYDHIYNVICNYVPYTALESLDNVVVRQIGSRESSCSNPNVRFSSLCGDTRPYSEDTFTAPMNLNSARIPPACLSNNFVHIVIFTYLFYL